MKLACSRNNSRRHPKTKIMTMATKRNKDTEVKRTLRIDCAELRVREAAEGEAPSRTITGYAILFNTPSAPLWSDEDSEAREVIAPEAITKELLDGCDIKFTMYHDRQLILGRSNKVVNCFHFCTFEISETAESHEATVSQDIINVFTI